MTIFEFIGSHFDFIDYFCVTKAFYGSSRTNIRNTKR